MILLSIAVDGFQRFNRPLKVDFDPQRINVLHGPNGAGKSTLLRALARCLMDRHQVGGKGAQAMVPWGTHVAPRVRVEFIHAGVTYRLEKRFHRDAFAKLESKRGYHYEAQASGSAVNERLAEMFRSNPAGMGVSGPANWGLGAVLWSPQNSLPLGDLGVSLLEQIRNSLGAQMQTAAARRIEKAAEKFYLSYFTPTGKLKMGAGTPEFMQREAELLNLEEQIRALEEAREQLRGLETRVTQSGKDRDQARRRVEAIEAQMESIHREAESYSKLDTERGQLESRRQLLTEQHGNLRSRLDRIAQLQASISQWNAGLQDLEPRLDQARKALAEDRAAAACVADRKELTALEGRLESIRQHGAALDRAESELGNLRAPSAQQLNEIRGVDSRMAGLRAKLDAALIRLEVTPSEEREVIVVSGDPAGAQHLAAGQPFRSQGSPEVVLEIPGFGRVRATGPSESAAQLRSELEAAEKRYSTLTEPFGTRDIQELERRRARASELEAEVRSGRALVSGLLGRDAAESLAQRAEQLAARIREAESAHPDWAVRTPAPDVEGRERVVGQLESAVGTTKGLLANAQPELASLSSGAGSPPERRQELDQMAATLHGVVQRLEEVRGELARSTGDPRQRLQAMTAEEQQIRQRLQTLERAFIEDQAVLKTKMAEAPYDKLALEQERAEVIRRERDSGKLRADAARLLWHTVVSARESATAGVSEPVAEEATRMFQWIAGRRLGEVRINDKLSPVSFQPAGAGEPVELDQLSGGEFEQVHFVTRLALAKVLTEKERHLVVLDDVLTATDDERMARILRLLGKVNERAQVLILTCHPERYEALSEANRIDLPALLGNAG